MKIVKLLLFNVMACTTFYCGAGMSRQGDDFSALTPVPLSSLGVQVPLKSENKSFKSQQHNNAGVDDINVQTFVPGHKRNGGKMNNLNKKNPGKSASWWDFFTKWSVFTNWLYGNKLVFQGKDETYPATFVNYLWWRVGLL